MPCGALQIVSSDGSCLVIEKGDEPVPLRWRAGLTSSGLTATAELDNDPILFSQPMLRDYFAELAAAWRGWTGTRTWAAGALAFGAEHVAGLEFGGDELGGELSRRDVPGA